MKIITAKLAAIGTAAALALSTLTGCGDEGQEAPAAVEYAQEDCDPEDLAGYEEDCGYWDGVTGQFILWYWVLPGLGGTAPAGWDSSRHVPQSGTLKRPANAKLVAPQRQPAPAGAPAPKAPAPRVVAPAAPKVNAPAPARPAAPAPAAPRPAAPAPKVGK